MKYRLSVCNTPQMKLANTTACIFTLRQQIFHGLKFVITYASFTIEHKEMLLLIIKQLGGEVLSTSTMMKDQNNKGKLEYDVFISQGVDCVVIESSILTEPQKHRFIQNLVEPELKNHKLYFLNTDFILKAYFLYNSVSEAVLREYSTTYKKELYKKLKYSV